MSKAFQLWSVLGVVRALRRAPVWKLRVVMLAYCCFFLVIIGMELGSSAWFEGLINSSPVLSTCGEGFRLLRVKQHDLTQFRLQQLHSEAFKEEVQTALRPMPYDTEEFVVKQNWAAYDGTKALSNSDIDIVMTLQASPDRLPFIKVLADRWQGPISLSLYIPAPQASGSAAACRASILEFISPTRLSTTASAAQAHPLNGKHPLAVSFLFATGHVPNLSCKISSDLTGLEKRTVDQVAFQQRFVGSRRTRPAWQEVLAAEYPVNALRALAREMVRVNAFVFMAEADFMPMHNMHSQLRHGASSTLLTRARRVWADDNERHAIILPAFERIMAHPPAPPLPPPPPMDTASSQPDAGRGSNQSGDTATASEDVPGKHATRPLSLFDSLYGWSVSHTQNREQAAGRSAGEAGGADLNATEGHGPHARRAPQHGSRWGWHGCAPRSEDVTQLSRCWIYEGYDVPLTKSELKSAEAEGRVAVFHERLFPPGHSCYDAHYWLENGTPYEIQYRNPCEPYTIALRDSLPAFDPRFRGRDRDKVSILTHMAAWGAHFIVDPDHFLLHLPHPPVVPLAAMSKDPTVQLYARVVPFVLTQIMLEELREQRELYRNEQQEVPGVGYIFLPPKSHGKSGVAGVVGTDAAQWTPNAGRERAPDTSMHVTASAGGATEGVGLGRRGAWGVGSAGEKPAGGSGGTDGGGSVSSGSSGALGRDREVQRGPPDITHTQAWVADLLQHLRHTPQRVLAEPATDGVDTSDAQAVTDAFTENATLAAVDLAMHDNSSGGTTGAAITGGTGADGEAAGGVLELEAGNLYKKVDFNAILAGGAHALAPLLFGEANRPECTVDTLGTLERCVALSMALVAFTALVVCFL